MLLKRGYNSRNKEKTKRKRKQKEKENKINKKKEFILSYYFRVELVIHKDKTIVNS